MLPPFVTKGKAARNWLALSVKTSPNKLPELLINLLSSQGPQLLGATLSTLLRAVHPGTIAMTDFRRGLRPRVVTHHHPADL